MSIRPFWGATAELSPRSVNGGPLVHACAFPPPSRRKGGWFCSRSVPGRPRVQAGWVLYEAVNMPAGKHARRWQWRRARGARCVERSCV